MLFAFLECVRGWLMPFPFWKKSLGKRGEYLARRYYRRRGYHLVAANWRHGHGEIDLIVANWKRLVFVEVKARTRKEGFPVGNVISYKQRRRLLRLARVYRNSWAELEFDWRFHLVLLKFKDPTHFLTEITELFE